MSIFFTSDTHFFHENVITHSKRPFASLVEMHIVLIENWNKTVKSSDTVYHLGDFAVSWGRKSKEGIENTLNCLHGRKILIKGNHDRKEVLRCAAWDSVHDKLEIKVDAGGPHKRRIILDHYAPRTWNQMHRGSIALHGHSHGSLSDIGGKTADCGVDVRGFKPWLLEDVLAFMDGRDIVSYDHHQPNESEPDSV